MMTGAITSVSGTTFMQMTTVTSLKINIICIKVTIKTQRSLQQDCVVAMCVGRHFIHLCNLINSLKGDVCAHKTNLNSTLSKLSVPSQGRELACICVRSIVFAFLSTNFRLLLWCFILLLSINVDTFYFYLLVWIHFTFIY